MKENERRFFVDIANPSERRVKVSSIIIAWDDKSEVYPDFVANVGSPEELPFVLVPGDGAGISSPTEEFVEWLRSEGARGEVQIRARVVDALGKNYRSRKLTISVPLRTKQ